MTTSTTYTDSSGDEWSWDDIDQLKECPCCGSDALASGCWIPTMTADLECEDCNWGISYPYDRPT